MWKSKVFWKIYLSYLLLIACLFAFAAYFARSHFEFAVPQASSSEVNGTEPLSSLQTASMNRVLFRSAVAAWLLATIFSIYVASRIERQRKTMLHSFRQMERDILKKISLVKEEQARLKAILAGMAEGVLVLDEYDRLHFCNSALKNLLGSGAVLEIGAKAWDTMLLYGFADLLKKAKETQGPVRKEINIFQGKSKLVLDGTAIAIRKPEVQGVMLVLHDITELKRLESVRRDFVANVSHELKTPLTSIKGYVETLLEGAIWDKGNNLRFLQKIDIHVTQLAELVEDLLTLAQIEASPSQRNMETVNLHQIVENAVSTRELPIKRKGLKLEVIPPNEEVMVAADRKAVTQVFDNLLDNAVKYTPTSGCIRVSLSKGEAMGELVVEDTGQGIPKEELSRIFERFYRVDKSRSPNIKGTGLGLSIVKHLVGAMKGEINVESQLGHGSRFTVNLPLV